MVTGPRARRRPKTSGAIPRYAQPLQCALVILPAQRAAAHPVSGYHWLRSMPKHLADLILVIDAGKDHGFVAGPDAGVAVGYNDLILVHDGADYGILR